MADKYKFVHGKGFFAGKKWQTRMLILEYRIQSALGQERIIVDFVIANWYLFAAALLSGTFLLFPGLMGDHSRSGMELSEAILKMNREKGVLVDVREPGEYATVHIAQSRNIALAQVEEKLPASVKNKALPVLFICNNGNRSATAAKKARKLGYEHAYSIAGGMKSWVDANMPVVTAAHVETKQA